MKNLIKYAEQIINNTDLSKLSDEELVSTIQLTQKLSTLLIAEGQRRLG